MYIRNYVIYTQFNTLLLQYWVIHISGHIIETCPVSCGVICTCCRLVLHTVCYARLHMAAQHVFQMCRTVLKEFDLRAEAQAGVNNIITNLVFLQMGYCDWGDLSHFFWFCSGSLRSVQFQPCNCCASPRGIHRCQVVAAVAYTSMHVYLRTWICRTTCYNEVFPKVVLWLKLTDGHNMPWLMINITGYNVIWCLECCPNGPGVRPCVLLPICWWNGTNPIIAGKLLTVQPALERRDVFR